MDFDLPKDKLPSIIKAIGVGGGGGNAVNHMYKKGIEGVDFIVCNTDLQALNLSPVPHKIQLGPSLTEGRGAGSKPEIGKNAAIENIEEIREFLSDDAKMVFITAGMGGGTGTGAAPVIAKVARELGILTVGIVTVPFAFEGRKRRMLAEEGLEQMRQNVDTLLVINNEKLREITSDLTISQAFAQADDILATAAKGIADVIEITGDINVDFNDVNTVMKDSGVAIMGSAAAEGENRAMVAVEKALESPLLNDNDINGAKHVLLYITYGNKEVMMEELTEVTDFVQEAAGMDAEMMYGHGYDETLGDQLNVTVIATGFSSSPITGFEKAPEKNVTVLEEVKEIKAPLNSPTEKTNTWENAKEVKAETKIEEKIEEDEPFLVKKKEEEKEIIDEQQKLEFSWDEEVKASVESINTQEVVDESEIKRYNLDDDTEIVREEEVAPKKEALSSEEFQRRSQERMEKIAEFTEKLKNPEGIQEYLQEPAYARKNIELDNSTPSKSVEKSKFSVGKDKGGDSSSLSNNSFLHDNVD